MQVPDTLYPILSAAAILITGLYKFFVPKMHFCAGYRQGRIKTLGGPMPKGHGGPPLPSSPFPLRPFPLRSPSPSSRPILCPISPLLSLRSGHLNTAMGSGEHCKLPQWGLGQSPSRQTIWCIFESKRAALVAAIFCGVLRKNICNFHYFLHNNN